MMTDSNTMRALIISMQVDKLLPGQALPSGALDETAKCGAASALHQYGADTGKKFALIRGYVWRLQ